MSQWRELAEIWPVVFVATLGIVVGTVGGQRVLRTIDEARFRQIVSVLLITLGVHMLFMQGR